MEANVREVRMGKAKGRRETKRSREETEKREDNRSQKSGRGVGNLG